MEKKELSLQEIQKESLKILKDVDLFCRKNSIKYYIMFGTLIGAVRHKGFIPWDDDVDIAMTREDYNRFLEEYKKNGKYRIVNYLNDASCPYMITRVTNDEYTLYSDYGPDYKIGTFIDVYPFDGVGKDEELILKKSKISRRFSSGLGKSLERNIIKCVKETHNGIKKWVLLFTYIVPKIRGVEAYRKKLIELKEVFPSYEESKYIGCITWNMIRREVFDKSWFDETIDLEFEDIVVMAPANYDAILTQNYGNYMQIPPEKDRIAHHYYRIFKTL